MKRKTLTILFADVQGYTSRTGSQTREQNEQFVAEIRTFVHENILEKGGTLVKTMGDGFLITFESPTDAVVCGIAMQNNIAKRNATVISHNKIIRFRIGISTGEVTEEDNHDVIGDAVNIAARIQTFCVPNEVYISEATYLAMNKSEIQAMDLGPQRFKNVAQEIRVYKVMNKSATATGSGAQSVSPFPRKTAVLILLALLGIGGGTFYYLRLHIPSPNASLDQKIAQIEKLLQQAAPEPAGQLIRQLLADNPENPQVHVLAAQVAEMQHDDTTREHHLRYVTELDPDGSNAYRQLSLMAEQQKNFSLAVEMLAEYIKREPDPTNRNQAIAHMRILEEKNQQQKRDEQSPREIDNRRLVQQLQEQAAAAAEPTDIPLRNTRPLDPYQPQFSPTNQTERPMPAAQPVNEEEIRIFEKLRQNVQIAVREKNFPEALSITEQALTQNPNNIKIKFFASELFMRLKEFDRAEAVLTQVIAQNPDNLEPYRRLADICIYQHNYGRAVEILEEYIRREPDEFRRSQAQQKLDRLPR